MEFGTPQFLLVIVYFIRKSLSVRNCFLSSSLQWLRVTFHVFSKFWLYDSSQVSGRMRCCVWVSECDSADVSPQYCLGTTSVWLAWSFSKHVSRQSSVWCISPVEISPKNLRKGYACYLGQKIMSFSNVALNVKSLTWHFQQGSLENNIFAAGMRFLAEILPCLCYEPCVWGSFKKYLPKELEERIWLIWFDQILSWIWLIQERIWEEQSIKTIRQLFTNWLDFLINKYMNRNVSVYERIWLSENQKTRRNWKIF